MRKKLQIASLLLIRKWRGVRDLNPRGPKDHRLSRLVEATVISYPVVRDDFITWLNTKELSERYRNQVISYLDRFVGEIKEPMDISRMFEPLTRGQRKNLNRALRNLFNFLGKQGFNKPYLNLLRENIPKDRIRIDIRVPAEGQIIKSIELMAHANPRYNAIYNLVVDSGLRLSEAVQLYNNLSETEIQDANGFYVATLGYFRECKIAYYAFFTSATMELLRNRGQVSYQNTRGYLKDHDRNVTTWKYLRKFAFDKMIELDIPESVADFIQGRTPKKIGAKHYMVLARQAKKFYPRYVEYITRLRQKALN